MQQLTDQFSYQSVVDDLAESAGSLSAVIDKDRVNIAHSNAGLIGTVTDHEGVVAAAQKGERYAAEFFYEAEGANVYDVLLPLVVDGEHVGAINIGLSMADVYRSVREVLIVIVTIGAVALVLLGGILLFISLGIVRSRSQPKAACKNGFRGLQHQD